MPKNALTDLSLRALPPPTRGQKTIWDSLPNFGVRVSQGGTKSFVVLLGSGQRHTIGRYPVISLQEARGEAKRLLAERTLGKLQPTAITFEQALPRFIAAQYQGKRERSRRETERLLRRHFLPKLRNDRLTQIATEKLARILDSLAETPSVQHNACIAMGTFLRWALVRRYLIFNPLEGIRYPCGKARTRILDKLELSSIWHATNKASRFGLIVRLCILLGQRRGEIAALHSDYIDWTIRTITFPPHVVKNNRTHSLPFGESAELILRSLPSEGYLFPGEHGAVVFNGWSKSKSTLDRDCKIAHWTLHDLRRTFSTNLAELSVAPHVIERLLNHSSGIISGVSAIYNRHTYIEEMRSALALWEKRLQVLCKK